MPASYTEVTDHVVTLGDHRMAYHAAGPDSGTAVIFAHGWPELGHSWRHQLPVLGGLGFRAIGETLPGTVTGVTHFGLFVTLDELYVDGLVHVTALGNDYFPLSDGGLQLTGERSGRSYSLGDAVEVEILRVDTDEAKVDFQLADSGRVGKTRADQTRAKKSGAGKTPQAATWLSELFTDFTRSDGCSGPVRTACSRCICRKAWVASGLPACRACRV